MVGRNSIDMAIELFREAYELQMSGEVDEAIETYKRSIALVPTTEAHTFLGWAYSFQKRFDKAIEECKKAINIDPDFGNPYNDIGAYLIELGSYDEAIPWLEKAKNAKRYDPRHYSSYNMGRAYVLKGMVLKAMEEFNHALELSPEYAPALEALERLRNSIN